MMKRWVKHPLIHFIWEIICPPLPPPGVVEYLWATGSQAVQKDSTSTGMKPDSNTLNGNYTLSKGVKLLNQRYKQTRRNLILCLTYLYLMHYIPFYHLINFSVLLFIVFHFCRLGQVISTVHFYHCNTILDYCLDCLNSQVFSQLKTFPKEVRPCLTKY